MRAAWALAFAWLGLSLAASEVSAQTGSTLLVAPRLDDDDGRRIPFTLGFKLESTVGQGTFVQDPNARNSHIVWGASIAPGYRPTDDLMLSVYGKVIQEVSDSELDTQRQQLLLLDMNLRADYAAGTIPELDVDVGLGLWLYLPTSLASQFESLIVGPALRLTLHRDLGEHFALDFLGMFRKNIHEYESPVVNAVGSDPPPVFVRQGGAEDLPGTLVAVGVQNVSYLFYNLGWVTWSPSERWYMILAYGMNNAFAYGIDQDELSSPFAEGGAGQRDNSVGVFEVGHVLDERFMLAAGITTTSAPKTEDNQSFRFPFYDFEGTARNFTLFYVDITVSEAIGD